MKRREETREGRDRSEGNRVRGKKLTVTFCFIASYISIERVTQRNRGGRRGWQGKRRMEKEKTSECRHREEKEEDEERKTTWRSCISLRKYVCAR